MGKATSTPYIIKSVSELHRLFALPKPDHPLITVIDFAGLSFRHSDVWKHFATDFYCIAIKNSANAKFKYGQQDYDFDEGVMTCTKPGQVASIREISDDPVTGYFLAMKPDLLRGYPMAKSISNYGFFSYSVAEALHLSDKEDAIVMNLMRQIQDELKNNIDHYSQDVIVSHVELLLSYANRFYNRQFITRKSSVSDLLTELEQLLTACFDSDILTVKGLPTVQQLAGQLNMSPNYLSDMLRSQTGLSAQQYIHDHMIRKAQELLSTTDLSVSEIAYHFGFSYPQSFNKLFKKKTMQTPLQYRQSFN
jgi:AraC family transcriptional regulator, transcriptional activator of pobA